jgi:hypothetical protein
MVCYLFVLNNITIFISAKIIVLRKIQSCMKNPVRVLNAGDREGLTTLPFELRWLISSHTKLNR